MRSATRVPVNTSFIFCAKSFSFFTFALRGLRVQRLLTVFWAKSTAFQLEADSRSRSRAPGSRERPGRRPWRSAAPSAKAKEPGTMLTLRNFLFSSRRSQAVEVREAPSEKKKNPAAILNLASAWEGRVTLCWLIARKRLRRALRRTVVQNRRTKVYFR